MISVALPVTVVTADASTATVVASSIALRSDAAALPAKMEIV